MMCVRALIIYCTFYEDHGCRPRSQDPEARACFVELQPGLGAPVDKDDKTREGARGWANPHGVAAPLGQTPQFSLGV